MSRAVEKGNMAMAFFLFFGGDPRCTFILFGEYLLFAHYMNQDT